MLICGYIRYLPSCSKHVLYPAVIHESNYMPKAELNSCMFWLSFEVVRKLFVFHLTPVSLAFTLATKERGRRRRKSRGKINGSVHQLITSDILSYYCLNDYPDAYVNKHVLKVLQFLITSVTTTHHACRYTHI